ncbi:transmembrane protein 268 isoform X2 [Alligator mississippiensis]|uniref:transmembrane protein 268 isoform X2 n=1 Tax=Alligator mississippiensis TaxID=8496 RepID=UPI0028776EFD|nr:transmembrane protein 268 isoform X2 [Alligator mississippiensis]
MSHESQANGAEKNGSLSSPSSSIFYSKNHLVKELHNGQVLTVLSAINNFSSISFDLELCVEKLKNLGIQMTMDEWRSLIQNPVLKPEIRRYMFYNSRAFRIAIAVIFYISLWTNIYSIMRLYAFGRYWEISILVTFVAVAVTIIVILIIDRYQRKINVNTDVRLAAANEAFMRHNLLVGITDAMDRHQSILQVSLCCESALKRSLDQLCIVIETVIQPAQERGEESSSEEAPLLTSKKNLKKRTLTCSDLMQLIPQAAPEVMARHLLVIFSGNYVRLLVNGQLPQVIMLQHMEHSNAPCPCEFIKTSVLNTGHCCFKAR